MRVVIVGNSNCVFKFGFSKLIRDVFEEAGHEVFNLSVGGSCSLFHIYTLHTNRELIEGADIVILDSMIIDTYHHRRGLLSDEQIATSIHDMYASYAALDALIVSVYFPSMAFVGRHRDAHIYSTHRKACDTYNIAVVDIYEELDDISEFESFFMKDSHIKVEFSQKIAELLAQHLLAQNEIDTRPKCSVVEDPYKTTDLNEAPLDALETAEMSSKFFDKTAGILDRPIDLGAFAGSRLMGVFQWNRNDGSRLRLTGETRPDVIRQLRAQFALFDVFPSEPEIVHNSQLSPAEEHEETTEGMKRANVKDSFGTPHLMGMLFKALDTDLTTEIAMHAKDKGRMDLTPIISGKIFVVED